MHTERERVSRLADVQIARHHNLLLLPQHENPLLHFHQLKLFPPSAPLLSLSFMAELWRKKHGGFSCLPPSSPATAACLHRSAAGRVNELGGDVPAWKRRARAGAFDSDRQIALKFSQGTEAAPSNLITRIKGRCSVPFHPWWRTAPKRVNSPRRGAKHLMCRNTGGSCRRVV